MLTATKSGSTFIHERECGKYKGVLAAMEKVNIRLISQKGGWDWQGSADSNKIRINLHS